MFKFIVIVALLTIEQISTENVLPNKEVDEKLSVMWSEVNIHKRRVNRALEDEYDPTPLAKAIEKMFTVTLRRLEVHFNNTEEQARITGKLDNVLVDSVFTEIMYDEMKEANFFPLVKEVLKSLSQDKNVQKIMYPLFDKGIDITNEGIQALIQEMKNNPKHLFNENFEEEKKEKDKKYQQVIEIYSNKVIEYKNETLAKLKQIGKESELQKVTDYLRRNHFI